MSLTQEQLASILGTFWIAQEMAKERLEMLREDLAGRTAGEAARALSDLDEIGIYLNYRCRAFEPSGLLTALMTSHGVVIWPNTLPTSETKADYVAAWLDRNPNIKAKREQRKDAERERLQAAIEQMDRKRARLKPQDTMEASA